MGLNGCLAALLLPGPAHGYQLKGTLEAELGALWETRASHIYMSLGRMVRDGLVTSRRIRQDTRPDRQLLELTTAGRQLAQSWLFESGPADEIVVRVAVGRVVVPDRFAELLDRVVAERSAALRQLRAMRPEVDEGFHREALEEEVMRTQAQLRWATLVREQAEELLRRPAAQKPQVRVARDAS